MLERTLECRVLDTGSCLAFEALVVRGGAWRVVECPSLVALIRHPREGWILWDAGYAPRLVECTRRFPARLYRTATPLRVRPEQCAAAQLARLGVGARDVRHVVLSHFHADHVAGLRDFERATLWAREDAYADVAGRSGFAALRRAFVPELLPRDFERRAQLLPAFTGTEHDGLGATLDLFGDGSLVLVDLPGHARGQFGLRARTESGELLFAADACWMRRGYRTRRGAHWITRLITDDDAVQAQTLERLARFAETRPDVVVVPSHCPEARAELVRAPRFVEVSA